MVSARIIDIENIAEGKEEIRKIGVDSDSINWLGPKSIFLTVKIENVSSAAANIVKQEMLGKGGDVAVNRNVFDLSMKNSDILVMGTYNQFQWLVQKLKFHSPEIRKIAEEIVKTLHYIENNNSKSFDGGKFRLPLGEKTYVMGILNVTPDSFSDGGKYNHVESAVKRAMEMVKEGVDIIDIGGESTRPGFIPVDPFEEINRVVPVIEALSKEADIPISIDTTKAIVAKKALDAGACIVNDVWGLQRDEKMAEVVAEYSAGIVIMHNSETTEYKDLIGDIVKFFQKSIQIAENAGIQRENIAIDPGIGFGKTLEQNLLVMKKLKELRSIGYPILLGTSKKSMIGKILDLPVENRLEGTSATVTLGIANGADIVRVHDVKEMTRVVRMTDAMIRE
jgi:dihydropteroate synthase